MKNMTNAEKVREFMISMGQDVDQPTTNKLLKFRHSLIEEEFEEVTEAIFSGGEDEILKELCDVLYVVYGAAATFGWDIDTAFNRVHQSNMSKLGDDGKPVYREDGKVIKSKNYIPPVLKDLV